MAMGDSDGDNDDSAPLPFRSVPFLTEQRRLWQTCRDIHVRVIMRCAPFFQSLISCLLLLLLLLLHLLLLHLLLATPQLVRVVFSLINKMDLHFRLIMC